MTIYIYIYFSIAFILYIYYIYIYIFTKDYETCKLHNLSYCVTFCARALTANTSEGDGWEPLARANLKE